MNMLDYYKDYFGKGGVYTCEHISGPTSRPYLLTEWLKAYTKPGDKILDVGCGDLYLSTKLPDRQWTGVDINTEKAKGNALTWDLMNAPYPFAEGYFDAVVCSEVLEHVWRPETVHAEAFRLLKPGGVYLISTPNHYWIDNVLSQHVNIAYDPSRPWTMEHIRQYTPVMHQHLLTQAGFKVEDWTGLDAHYGTFFQEARAFLKFILTKECGAVQYEDEAKVDYALGRMFPNFSHTIAFLSRRP